jgi:hypothetical protein
MRQLQLHVAFALGHGTPNSVTSAANIPVFHVIAQCSPRQNQGPRCFAAPRKVALVAPHRPRHSDAHHLIAPLAPKTEQGHPNEDRVIIDE